MTSSADNRAEEKPVRLARNLVLALAVATALVWFMPTTSSEQSAFMVYRDAEHCKKHFDATSADICQSMHEDAKTIAENMVWSFEDIQQCVANYGDGNCYHSQAIRVKMAGFTQFSNTTRFGTVLPVFHSSVHPGLYMPNAYPVLIGENTISTRLLEGGAPAAAKPRSLGDDLCVERKGEIACAEVHSFVTGSLVDRDVVSSLFASEAH